MTHIIVTHRLFVARRTWAGAIQWRMTRVARLMLSEADDDDIIPSYQAIATLFNAVREVVWRIVPDWRGLPLSHSSPQAKWRTIVPVTTSVRNDIRIANSVPTCDGNLSVPRPSAGRPGGKLQLACKSASIPASVRRKRA
jgi:hypothetical protein